MQLPFGLSHVVGEVECQLKAVEYLAHVHLLPRNVAEASVYAAGWVDVNLCLNWAHHYGKDYSLVKENSKKFWNEVKERKADEPVGNLRSGAVDVSEKLTDLKFGSDEKIKSLEKLVLSDMIKDLLVQFNSDCDHLEFLETKERNIEHFVKFFNVGRESAIAAVQAVGVDSRKCQEWIKNNRDVDVVDDLVSAYCDEREAISFLRDKMFRFNDVFDKMNIEEDLAKAAVQSGASNVAKWVYDKKKEVRDLACVIYDLSMSDCPEHVAELAKKYDSAIADMVDFDQADHTVSKLTEIYKIDFESAIAAVQSEGYESMELLLDWIEVNESNTPLVRELYGEYLVERCYFKEFAKKVSVAKDMKAKYGLDEKFGKAFIQLEQCRTMEQFFSWIKGCSLSISNNNQATSDPVKELEDNFDVGQRLLHKLEQKDNAVSILKERYPAELAKAAVQSCGTNEKQCKIWIEKYKNGNEALRLLIREYERELEPVIALKQRELAMITLVEVHRFSRKLAKAAVQLNGSDITKCRKWIVTSLQSNNMLGESKSESHSTVQILIENFGYSWNLASAAVQRSGHKSCDDCLEWIADNRSMKREIGEASWEYRLWQARDILGFDMPKLMPLSGLPDKSPLSLTFSILTEEYHFSPILAQAAISHEGIGLSKIQKCKAWAETHREEYEYVALWCNQLELRILEDDVQKELSKKVEEKAVAMTHIGKAGGCIEFLGCSAEFPPGAVDSELDLEIVVSVDNNSEKYPKNCLPVTPIFGCKSTPKITFKKPVKIRMRTSYSAVCNNKIPGKVLCKKSSSSDWDKIEEVTISDEIYVCFKVSHFCGHVVGVAEENADCGEYHFLNDVYIQRKTARIASVFTKDKKTQQDLRETLREQGFLQFLPVTQEINQALGVTIDLQLECQEPTETAVVGAMPASSFEITRDFLKLTQHAIYFKLNPRPGDDVGVIEILYNLGLGGRRIHLPLTTLWPIHIRDRPSTVNIGSNTGTLHTAATTYQANQLATGNARLEVSESTSVITHDEPREDDNNH